MALRWGDRVLETSTTTGTGAFTLAAAVTGYRRFADVPSMATSDTCYYAIYAVDDNGNPSGDWETGLGTYSSANTLTRTTPSASTNGGAAVNFGAGTKYVMLTPTAAMQPSAFALTLLDDASASAARTTLGAAAASPSVQSVVSSATVTPTFADDAVRVTAQAAALALANPTGTAVPMWGWAIRIKDNGTARAISYGTQYRAIGVTLPTTTVISKTLYLGCIWNDTDTKVDVVAVAQEA